ncbi:MAG: hypothetical protein Q7K54_04465 [Candidatus Parcubacteria bacterium]|nr:hypothetical protein [Candidatus Parcubacteria bacterium]
MLNFLKYYFSKILRTWWSVLLALPLVPALAKKCIDFYLGEKFSNYLSPLVGLFYKYHFQSWVLFFAFWWLHVWLIYKLYNSTFAIYDVGLSEKCSNILNHINRLFPEKSSKVMAALKLADKNYLSSENFKLIIFTNFSAHKIIYDIIDKIYNTKDVRLEISQQSSEIKSRYDNNFRELQEYNRLIGCNDTIDKNVHEIRKLVEDINDSLNSLFGYIQ